MRSHSPAIPVIDRQTLPPELEARIAALEADQESADFDSVSWLWMILFGIVLPLVLLVVGFRL
jgi:hypothetical protein